MSIQVRCPNLACGRVFTVKDEAAGKKVRCSQCGMVFPVPTETTGPQKGSASSHYHPARRTCTNCGTVLSARATICPGCGGDVRTGVTQMRITAEEKETAGLGALLRQMKGKGKRRSPVRRLVIGAIVLLVVAGLVFAGLWLARNWSSGGRGSGGAEAHAAERSGR